MCSFIRTEYDTRVTKVTNCSVDRIESAKLTDSGLGRFQSAGVSASISFPLSGADKITKRP